METAFWPSVWPLLWHKSIIGTYRLVLGLYSRGSAETKSESVHFNILLENYRILTFYSRKKPRTLYNSGGKQVFFSSLILNSDSWSWLPRIKISQAVPTQVNGNGMTRDGGQPRARDGAATSWMFMSATIQSFQDVDPGQKRDNWGFLLHSLWLPVNYKIRLKLLYWQAGRHDLTLTYRTSLIFCLFLHLFSDQ